MFAEDISLSDAELSDADTLEPWEMVTQLDIDALNVRLTALEESFGIY